MEKSLGKVYKSALKFLIPLSLEETYKIIVSEALKLVDGDYGSISMIKGRRLERAYASSATLFKIEPRKKGYTYGVYKSRKAIVLKRRRLTGIHPELKKLNVRSDILIPLVNRGNSIGVLTVLSIKKFFRKRELELLQLFGPLATLAISKAVLYDELDKAL
jgi:transcriptional regulator with GAF, ATPase, and Fis domain